jgi:CRISPR system Cascade subunit CasD
MAVLLLLLKGPLQSWGSSSRFSYRQTCLEPTKSAVIGLLASAQGRTREDSIEDLAKLRFAVRADQPGEVIHDFQTERALPWQSNAKRISMPITHRDYLADAVFLVALGTEGDEGVKLLRGIRSAVSHPCWPLYLGRRSCPPSPAVKMWLIEDESDPVVALQSQPWQAADWYQRRHYRQIDSDYPLSLAITADAPVNGTAVAADGVSQTADSDGQKTKSMYTTMEADHPLSFSMRHREYALRSVIHTSVLVKDLPNSYEVGSNHSGSVRHTDTSPAFTGDSDPMGF